jgi:hypothetical protein
MCIIIYHNSLLNVEITSVDFVINCDEEMHLEKSQHIIKYLIDMKVNSVFQENNIDFLLHELSLLTLSSCFSINKTK